MESILGFTQKFWEQRDGCTFGLLFQCSPDNPCFTFILYVNLHLCVWACDAAWACMDVTAVLCVPEYWVLLQKSLLLQHVMSPLIFCPPLRNTYVSLGFCPLCSVFPFTCAWSPNVAYPSPELCPLLQFYIPLSPQCHLTNKGLLQSIGKMHCKFQQMQQSWKLQRPLAAKTRTEKEFGQRKYWVNTDSHSRMGYFSSLGGTPFIFFFSATRQRWVGASLGKERKIWWGGVGRWEAETCSLLCSPCGYNGSNTHE